MSKKLAIFFLTHFTYGMIFNMFGPIIPYLAQESGQKESEFTFVFVLRGIAYLIAGFCQQSFLKQYSLIKRMLISCITSGICFVFFQLFYNYHLVASIVCLVMFLANGSMEVLINVLLMSASSKDPKQAISFSYGFYGFGGVMGSIIVSILGINALMFGGILVTLVGMLYLDLIEFKKTQKQILEEPMIRNENLSQSGQREAAYLRPDIEMMFCILFCIYAAISLSYRSWLPSFIVMQNFGSKQVAAISVSIYSAVLTLFRFVFMFWNPDIIKSLTYSSQILIVTLIVSLMSFYFNIQVVLIFGSSMILGIIFSSYVPYVYALPSEFGLSFTEKGTCNTIISYAIGEAVISAVIGVLMQWIHPIMLFVTMLFFSLLNRFYIYKTIYQLQRFQQEENQGIELKQKELLV